MSGKQQHFFGLMMANQAKELKKGTYNSIPEAWFGEYAKLEKTNPDIIPKVYDYMTAFDNLVKQEPILLDTGRPSEGAVKNIGAEIEGSLEYLRAGKDTRLDIADATGWFSSLTFGFGKLFGSFFGSAVKEEVVVARYQFGLVIRDFIRLFMLSKRFAIKEQEFLRDIMPGPGAFNSPPAARALMLELDKELDDVIAMYRNSVLHNDVKVSVCLVI